MQLLDRFFASVEHVRSFVFNFQTAGGLRSEKFVLLGGRVYEAGPNAKISKTRDPRKFNPAKIKA